MAAFLLASMKRKDSEVISEHHSDLALLSYSKKIKLSLDGELPLIIDEEATMTSEGFEAHVPKEQQSVLSNKSVKKLPSSDNLDMMTAAEEMITEDESAAARTSIFHTREENGWRNEPMEEEDEEKAMEVEDGTGEGGPEKQQEEWMAEEAQPRGVAPANMIWSGYF